MEMHQDSRALWFAFSTLAACLVGAGSGVLSWLGGATPPDAILAGGGALAATLLMFMAVIRFLTVE